MRLPFSRASKPTGEPTRPSPGKAAAGSVKDALGMSAQGPLQAARKSARRRLIGAAVLLAVGVIGFPLLFETQPRPLPVDTPFLLPEGSGRKVTAAVAPASPKLPPDAGLESGPTSPAAAGPLVTSAPAANGNVTVPLSPAASSVRASEATAPTPPTRVAQPPAKASAPATKVSEAVVPAPSASRPVAAKPQVAPAEAALIGTGRFVVQVGAYNDAERLRAARQKLEKLGLKSYTQDVETASGKRTRVRVGPFSTRKEADLAASKVKANGMQANILTL